MNERDKALADQVQWEVDVTYAELQKFASLIRAEAKADEREACAKVCDDEAKDHERNAYDAYDGRYDWQADGANACAQAIRARGNT